MRTSRHTFESPAGRRRALSVAVAGFACLATGATMLAGTAAAAPPERGSFHEDIFEVVEDFCESPGLTVQIAGTVDGRFTAAARGRDGLVYFMEHLVVEVEFTDLATGETWSQVERTVSKDLSVVDNGDGTLTIVVLATGVATLVDSDGKAFARNPGQVRFELLVDHGGTPADPEDDEVIEETMVKGSTGRSDDFCEATLALLA